MPISLTTIPGFARESAYPEHVSYSRITRFNQCNESYRLTYLQQHRGAPSEQLAIGSMVHGAIGAYYNLLRTKPRLGKAIAEQETLTALGDVMVGIVDDARSNQQELAFDRAVEDLEEDAAQLVSTYIKDRPKHIKPIQIERKITLPLGDDLPDLVGYVDVEAETSLVEIKTSGKSVTKPTGSWLLQALLYQSVIPKPVEWHVLVKTKTPRLLVSRELSIGYDAEACERALTIVRDATRRIMRLVDTLGTDEAWPMNGITHPWACNLCDARSLCPMGRLS